MGMSPIEVLADTSNGSASDRRLFQGSGAMRSIVNLIQTKRDQFRRLLTPLKLDEDGAALVEYTVLLAILLVAVIAIIIGVGGWILNQWSNLNAALASAP